MSAAALRVGRCPGALAPMASRDGLIVRVKPRGMAIPVERAWAVAAAAARHGSGLLDLTGRANLQVRGVAEAALPALQAELDALGLLDADAGAEARRNVVASPLMGLDPAAAFDVRAAVAALEAALAGAEDLAGLPGKWGVAVSDGGRVPLGAVSADVRFDARADGRFAVRLDGEAEPVAACAAREVPGVALRLARALVAAASADPALRRMRDLVGERGFADVLARAGLVSLSTGRSAVEGADRVPASRVPDRNPVGLVDLGPAFALAVAAPFGRLDAAQLDLLARGAARAGAAELRLAPWRAVLVPGLSRAAAGRLAQACAEAGLIVDPADPRLRVAACAGAPGCRRGTTPTLEHAAAFARLLGPGRGIALHVSGCAKGCAHPGAAPLTLVAEDGRYALVADGPAAGDPVARGLDADEARRLLRTILRQDRAP